MARYLSIFQILVFTFYFYFRLPGCSGTGSGGRMRLVLRVMAASALIIMAYATQVSAQTGFANMVDHLQLAAPDPIRALGWYRKNLGGQPTTGGTGPLK